MCSHYEHIWILTSQSCSNKIGSFPAPNRSRPHSPNCGHNNRHPCPYKNPGRRIFHCRHEVHPQLCGYHLTLFWYKGWLIFTASKLVYPTECRWERQCNISQFSDSRRWCSRLLDRNPRICSTITGIPLVQSIRHSNIESTGELLL